MQQVFFLLFIPANIIDKDATIGYKDFKSNKKNGCYL